MAERDIQHAIREALGMLPGVVVWRNNTGVAEYHGTKVRYGLGGVGGADLIGLVDGRFVAFEVKGPRGRTSDEQITFLRCVRRNGGFGAVVRSVDDALSAIERARNGESE